jgi:hypothetical protein
LGQKQKRLKLSWRFKEQKGAWLEMRTRGRGIEAALDGWFGLWDRLTLALRDSNACSTSRWNRRSFKQTVCTIQGKAGEDGDDGDDGYGTVPAETAGDLASKVMRCCAAETGLDAMQAVQQDKR